MEDMKAVVFLKEEGRMCKYFRNENGCIDCKFSCARNGKDMGCTDFSHNYPEEAVRIVEEWSREHPVKTNRQKFEEVFGIKANRYACPPHKQFACDEVRYAGSRFKCIECRMWWDKEHIEQKGE